MASKGQEYFIDLIINGKTERDIQRGLDGLYNLRGPNKIALGIDPLDSREVILEKIRNTYGENNADLLTANTLVIVERDGKLVPIDEDDLKKGEVIIPSNKETKEQFIKQNTEEKI